MYHGTIYKRSARFNNSYTSSTPDKESFGIISFFFVLPQGTYAVVKPLVPSGIKLLGAAVTHMEHVFVRHKTTGLPLIIPVATINVKVVYMSFQDIPDYVSCIYSKVLQCH